MKARYLAAACVVAALAVIGSTASAQSTGGTTAAATKIRIWLMTDAQSNWPQTVAAATAAFKKKHPAVEVSVEYQTWGNHLTKFDASLAGGDVPDVIELGNTETSKYMSAGGDQGHAQQPGRVRRRREEADEEVRERLELLGALLPREVLVRRDVVRLRLRRPDRDVQGREVARRAQLEAGDRSAHEGKVGRARSLARE